MSKETLEELKEKQHLFPTLKENLGFYGSILFIVGVLSFLVSIFSIPNSLNAAPITFDLIGMTGILSGVYVVIKSLDFKKE